MKRLLGNTRYETHPFGFGSYRTTKGNSSHETALRAYLAQGGNLIDTSANYGDGGSEKLIGHVIKDLARENIILVSKGGYIQGQNMLAARLQNFPETVFYNDDLWHSMHPNFLAHQLDHSLERLNTPYIDIYLLHNPEYFINHEAKTNPITEVVLDEFYRRIREAFLFLETEVLRGRIRYYGISSNNFGFHARDRARTSVLRCWEIAEKISSDHHFRVIQMPLNLYEGGGALFGTQDGITTLEFCNDKKIGVLVNRPLNAFYQNDLVRLADFLAPGEKVPGPDYLESLLQNLRYAEHEFSYKFGGEAFGEKNEGLVAYLMYVVGDLPSHQYWPGVMEQYVIPPVTNWLHDQREKFEEDSGWVEWHAGYVSAVNTAFGEIDRFLSFGRQKKSDEIRVRLYACGLPKNEFSLSQISLALVSQLSGISCVLCGMRRNDYVSDVFGALKFPVTDALQILEKFQKSIYGE